jgi:hypothetical protein
MRVEKMPGFRAIKFTHELDLPQVWEFIERMKEIIPPGAREYNTKSKFWTISELFMPEFDKLYDEMFKDENQTEMFK